MADDDDNNDEYACLEKLGDILSDRPPGGRRRNDGPAEITEHLYLGSMIDALDLDLLRRLRITHVLNCAPSAVRRYADSLRVTADDWPSWSWSTDVHRWDKRRGRSGFCSNNEVSVKKIGEKESDERDRRGRGIRKLINQGAIAMSSSLSSSIYYA